MRTKKKNSSGFFWEKFKLAVQKPEHNIIPFKSQNYLNQVYVEDVETNEHRNGHEKKVPHKR